MIQTLFVCLLRLGCEILLIWLVWVWWSSWHATRGLLGKVQRQGQTRQRHPQSPRDCPVCRAAHAPCAHREKPGVEAWHKQKSKRGRPKVIATEGYCCPNPRCRYYGVTDARLHALVGDGLHYGADTIQYLRCQACQTKVSTQWNTPLYDLKTPVRRVDEVMTATSEGVDVAAASRIFKHDERTIAHWLARTGNHAQRLHHHFSMTWCVLTCNWTS